MKAGRGAGDDGVAGGPARHVPVLLAEVLQVLAPRAGGLYLDATFGAGGYARGLLEAAPARVLATDRDPDAIVGGRVLQESFGDRLTLAQARFSEVCAAAQRLGFHDGGFQGIVFDVGVSSMQLDEAERGFSFRRDGPLDMRMSSRGLSAAEIVNEESEERLADIIFKFGEERASRRIARALVARRTLRPFATTLDLADAVARAAPGRPGDLHPATKTFQALRIAVNDELNELLAGLACAERLLAPGGRIAVVTFHSLEDRIVKQFLAERSGRGRARSRLLPGETAPPDPSFAPIGAQPVIPTHDEIARNPRARSAKLRAAERTTAPARPIESVSLSEAAALPAPRPRRR